MVESVVRAYWHLPIQFTVRYYRQQNQSGSLHSSCFSEYWKLRRILKELMTFEAYYMSNILSVEPAGGKLLHVKIY